MFLCTISYFKTNRCNRNSFCRVLSLAFFCWYLPCEHSAEISQHIWVTFAALSLSLSLSIIYIYIYIYLCGIYPDRTSHRARQRQLPYYPEKNPSWIAGNEVSATCCAPRRGMWKLAPPRFLLRFLIFYFPKSSCMRF